MVFNLVKARFHRERFKQLIIESKVELEGRVLDLCSGPISIASVYDPKNVVCYDYNDEFLKQLKYKGVSVVLGSIKDNNLPFQQNSFDYTFCSGPPMIPFLQKYQPSTLLGKFVAERRAIKEVISEIIRVTKNEAIINSLPFFRDFPEEYFQRVKREVDDYLIVLNCQD